MARSNTGSTSNWFENASAAVAAYPATLACWFNAANVTSTQNLISITNAGGSSYLSLVIDGNNEYSFNDQVVADAGGSGSAQAHSGSTYTANTWNHACAVHASATSHLAYLNGSAGSVATVNRTISPTKTNVGALRTTTTTFGPLNGLIGEAAVWNVALDAAEVAALAKGFCPLLIRPASLVAYWPLIGRYSPEIDLKGGFPLTMTGTMAQADHGPIIYPHRRSFIQVPAAGGAALVTPGALSIVMTGFAPSVLTPRTATPPKLSLNLTPFAPTLPKLATPGKLSLVTAGLAPTVQTPRTVTPPKLALSLTPFAPKLPKLVTPGTLSIATTGLAPSIQTPRLVTPGKLSLTTAGFAPSILAPRTVTPGTLALVMTAIAPIISTSRTVTPGTLSMILTEFAPTIQTPRLATPGAAALTITAFSPSALTPRTTTPGKLGLVLTTFAPLTGSSIMPTPGTLALFTTTYAPTITAAVSATPGTGTLTLATFAPVVSTPRTVSPSTATLTLAAFAPVISAGLLVVSQVTGRWVVMVSARKWSAVRKVRVWSAGSRNRNWNARGNRTMPLVNNVLEKTPGDKLRFSMDFSSLPELAGTGAIASITSVAASPSGLTISSPTIATGAKAASAVIESGAAGTDYDVTFTVVTAAGQIIERTGVLQVRAK